jgi:multimeric flavodoxin WrbA
MYNLILLSPGVIKMKILAINGSPTKDGNCHSVIQEISKYLKDESIEVEEVNLNQTQLHSCIACYKCFELQNGKCALNKDGFNDIQEKTIEADAIILVSPVYTASVTSAMKAFMERSSLVSMASGGLFDRKPVASIAVARRAGTMSTLEAMIHFSHVCGMISVGSSYWNVAFGGSPSSVLKDAEGLESIKNMTLNMAWLMKSLEASKDLVPQPETLRTRTTNIIREDL